MLTHIDLFSGIGGFTLACQWAGITTEVFCENDKRCQDFLRRTYPGIPIIPDIRKFDGSRWRGRFLLTGGVPCQPASRAGKQGGKKDGRWLWPEALRVVSEARPDWCLFENPLGINDVGLGGILADLEALGYEVAPPLIIPACAVNSPQIRQRYWIVANATNAGFQYLQSERGISEKETSFVRGDIRASQGDVADTESNDVEHDPESCPGSPGDEWRREFDGIRGLQTGIDPINFWANSIWLPCADGKFRRAPDDSFGVVNGLHRSVLAALGNSIVPQVVYEIIRAIKEADESTDIFRQMYG